tara:strand:+ start:257 stop:385 length:129 start_codon:yes stop_codon:yes gene_type:complete
MNNFTTKIDWEILYNQGENMRKKITTLATTTTQRLYTGDKED